MMQLLQLLLEGTPEGTVYTHDVNLNITYTHNWGVVTKTFKGNCNKKSTVNIRAKIESIV